MVYRDKPVEIPYDTKRIVKNRKGDTVYIYYTTLWGRDPDTGKDRIERTCIGKMCPSDQGMMYPNDKYFRFFREDEEDEDDGPCAAGPAVRVGAQILIRKTAEDTGLYGVLEELFGDDAAYLFDLAAFCLTEEGRKTTFDVYAWRHALFDESAREDTREEYKDDILSFMRGFPLFFEEDFFEAWGKRVASGRVYLSYGGDRYMGDEDDESPELEIGEIPARYFVAYGDGNEIPLFYEYVPHVTIDRETVEKVTKKAGELGYGDVAMFLDRGRIRPDAFDGMDEDGVPFVSASDLSECVRDAIRGIRGTFEDDDATLMPGYGAHGTTVRCPLVAPGDRERYAHVFFDRGMRERMLSDLDRAAGDMEYTLGRAVEKGFEVHESTYRSCFRLDFSDDAVEASDGDGRYGRIRGFERDDEAVKRTGELYGYFSIVTSEETGAQDAFRLLCARDPNEDVFIARRRFVNWEGVGVVRLEPYGEADFIEFVALILRCEIGKTLREKGVAPGGGAPMSAGEAVWQLDQVYLEEKPDGTYAWDGRLDAGQRRILSAFGITPAEFGKEARAAAGAIRGKGSHQYRG